jgi:hypothetical protein
MESVENLRWRDVKGGTETEAFLWNDTAALGKLNW